jgi:hypothetical protein
VGAASSELTKFGDEHRRRLQDSVKKSSGLVAFWVGEKGEGEECQGVLKRRIGWPLGIGITREVEEIMRGMRRWFDWGLGMTLTRDPTCQRVKKNEKRKTEGEGGAQVSPGCCWAVALGWPS